MSLRFQGVVKAITTDTESSVSMSLTLEAPFVARLPPLREKAHMQWSAHTWEAQADDANYTAQPVGIPIPNDFCTSRPKMKVRNLNLNPTP